ncbi:MogA/MoaB family molybdenum cofactor biosynthesis protein [Methanoregula sp.]|uniref:MogA/MoaB family molybdenum cofactor biosynthesis protein n=1 Tax=Methanoregula sp. TaxID=2052170 RepID=UPI003C7411C1
MSHAHERTIGITAAIITVSSTRVKENDLSGKAIAEILKENTIPVTYYTIVPDNLERIRNELFIATKNANCIIFNGGTGLTHDDCTIEAIFPLLEKKLDGFGELFRMKSFGQVGLSSMLSRAIAGISYGTAVFCIPGSTPAVTLATKELIVPAIAHILSHANLPKP